MNQAEWATVDRIIDSSLASYRSQRRAEIAAEKARLKEVKIALKGITKERIDAAADAELAHIRKVMQRVEAEIAEMQGVGSEGMKLLTAVGDEFGVPAIQIQGISREKEIVIARHVVMLLLFERGWNFPQVGRMLNRHHTTVISGIEALKAKRSEDPKLDERIKTLSGRLTCNKS